VTASHDPVPVEERLARILENLATECRKLVGSSGNRLDSLAGIEAESRPSAREPALREDSPMPITSTATPPLLLTQAQLCELLQVGPRTVRRLRSDPAAKFPAPIKRARVLRWRREEIAAWVAGRRP
jgi:predicted DNA-binding transcriptional regulator AlpA